ncbi:ParA family protein [Salibacterium aidingense]|uniref:ParA family protein n=1 Tax=Salibacterium aidingense TaxID=384933 RepID=UPI000416F04A|nr:ParA family protein [Salibacterium aidingense]
MGHTISFGLQKGGVGKTTSASITSYLLAEYYNYKVLAIDFDSQGNMTLFLTQQNIYDFHEYTILEAMKEKNAEKYIHRITDNLHIIPAEDYLITINRYLHTTYRGKGDPSQLLKEILEPIKHDYDYIVIDLPPNLGDQTINGLTASDYTVVVLQSDPLSYDALDRYMDFLNGVKEHTNPDLYLAGILTTMLDSRVVLDSTILDSVKEVYDDIVFNSIIKRRSRIKEFSNTGISHSTKNDQEVLEPYIVFVKELLDTINTTNNS